MTMFDRDYLIKTAISAPADIEAPAGLRDEIFRAVEATPQRRRAAWTRLFDWVGPLRRHVPALVLLAVALALLIGLLLALAQRPSPHRLTMYHGGPERTGLMPGPGPTGTPAILWDVARPGPLPFTTMPLVLEGVVFVADASGTVAALDAGTGAVTWEVRVGSPVRGTPALVNDLMVVGTDAGELIGLRTTDGARDWTAPLGTAPITASALVEEGRIYVGGEDGILHVVDAVDGRELWNYAMSGTITRGPALSRGVLFQGATGGGFVALDVATHQPRWSARLGPGEVGTPVVGRDLVYVARGLQDATSPRDLVALDIASGTQRWKFAAPDGRQVYAAGLAGGVLVVSSEGGSVFALDANSGAMIWTAKSRGVMGTLASIVDRTIYLGSDDHTVRAFELTSGRPLWSVTVAGLPTQQAVVDGRLFLGTSLGRMIAIGDGITGTPSPPSTD